MKAFLLFMTAQSMAEPVIATGGTGRPTVRKRVRVRKHGTARRLLIALLLIASVSLCRHSVAQESTGWGSLKGRLVFDWLLPEPQTLEITRDEAVCGDLGLVDESLVVNPQNLGIRYAVIWLESRQPVPVHPLDETFPEQHPVLDNHKCRFEPRLLAVRRDQSLGISNSDSIAHNAAVYARRNQPFNEVIAPGQVVMKSFPRPETQPIRVDCSIHAWMKAWIVVTDHPFVAITDQNGDFQIPRIPPGNWKFRFWHERPGYLRQLTQEQRPVPMEKGVWTLTIDADSELDLKELRAAADQFALKK